MSTQPFETILLEFDRADELIALGGQAAERALPLIEKLVAALDYTRAQRRCVLVTIKADGRPQTSNVFQWTDADGVVRVSLTDDRAKTRNLRRDPRVSLHVTAEDFWSYVVLEGEADLSPVAADPGDATCDELVAYYRALQGEHPDWDEYRAAMVADRRLVLRLRPTYAYGMVRD